MPSLRRSSPMAAPLFLLLLLILTPPCAAQDVVMAPGTYTDPETGIQFATWTAQPNEDSNGTFTFGMVLPEDAATKNATEYIGMLRCQSTSAQHKGWCGLAHAGHMVHDLLLMAWPYQDRVLTSFRWATDYFPPLPYDDGGNTTTNSTMTAAARPAVAQIGSWVNESGYEVVYRCHGCFSWNRDGFAGSVGTASVAGDGGGLVLGIAQALDAPNNTGCPGEITIGFHDNGYGQWAAPVENATNPSYSTWAALATQTPTQEC